MSCHVRLQKASNPLLGSANDSMGCVQSAPQEEPQRISPKIGKSWLLKQKERQQLKDVGRWPPSPAPQDPAPWVEGHKTFIQLKDGQGLFVQADTVSHE